LAKYLFSCNQDGADGFDLKEEALSLVKIENEKFLGSIIFAGIYGDEITPLEDLKDIQKHLIELGFRCEVIESKSKDSKKDSPHLDFPWHHEKVQELFNSTFGLTTEK